MVQVSLDQSYIQFNNHNNEKKRTLFTTEHFKQYFDNCNISFSQLKNNQKLSPMKEKKLKKKICL